MDDIIRNRDKLVFSANMDHGYICGYGYICGPRGHQGSSDGNPKPYVYTIPEGLMLQIKCNNNSELFSMLKDLVPHLNEYDVTIRVI